MPSQELSKFIHQIDTHWGDPLYASRKTSSGCILDIETWEYAKSRSKSIGILLEMTNNNGSYKYPFCLAIYFSGKLMNTLNNNRIFLNEFIKIFIAKPMINKLSTLPLNYGQILFFDELLFLVERGSLLLFSWSQSRLEWVQTPVLYLFNAFIRNEELFKLKNYISYSRMKRSGYKFRTSSNRSITKFQDNIKPEKNFLNCIDVEEYIRGIVIKRKITLSSINLNSESYLIKNSEKKTKDEEKNDVFFISKQPHDVFLIRGRVTGSNNHFVVSVISINSETRLKACQNTKPMKLSANDDSIHELDSKKFDLYQEADVTNDCYRHERYMKHPHAVRFVFAWMLIAQILRNYDTGALPVLLGLISDEFGLDEMKLGILGAVPYVSAMATAFVMNHPLQKYSQKWIIVTSLFFLSFGLALLMSSTTSTLLYISRIIMGSMQAPLSIYIPVWVDEFTPPNKLTTWMGASQVTMIIGVATGYLITGFTLNYHNGWRYSLLVPCLLLLFMSICLMFTKSEYFNVQYFNHESRGSEIEMGEGKINSNDLIGFDRQIKDDSAAIQCSIPSSCSTELVESPYNSIAISTKFIAINKSQENISSFNNTPFSFDTRVRKISNDFSTEITKSQIEKSTNNLKDPKNGDAIEKPTGFQPTLTTHYISISRSLSFSEFTNGTPQSSELTTFSNINIKQQEPLFNSASEDKSVLLNSKSSVFKRLIACHKWKCLLANSTYMLSITILSVIYYVVTAVQFWTTRYLQQIYTTRDGIIFMSFSATAVIAPTTGIIFSGFMIDFIGGYKSEHGLFYTMTFCMVSAIFATLFGVLALIVDNFTVTIVGIWGLLFFGSFLVPPITGISVGVVEPQIRQFATTVAMVTYHVFGFALGSLLPGAVLQLSGITRSGMTIVYGFSGLGVIANFFSCIIAYRRLRASKEGTSSSA
ncbi:major facilitator superfamily transporter [Cryptosporidium sp. chipmunk genotype I]|uniref:major facilitator superfamily transporter n=1 Tax=Cryptosporidium sp. chipmunk genotype I TaxID=1280935 RepID=UPI00351A3F78|nr:major facilitator superfamily transporter [Cryptosporidium sp. chipmunk genotype I]